MKRITMILLSSLVVTTPIVADTPTVCGVATLKDVQVVTDSVPQGTITVRDKDKKPGERDRVTYTSPSARKDKKYHVTVRLNDVLYTGESSGNVMGWTVGIVA